MSDPARKPTPVAGAEGSFTTSRFSDRFVQRVFHTIASVSILIVVFIFLFMLKEAVPFFSRESIGTMLNARWVPVSFQGESYGLYPLLAGSLVVTFIAGIIAVPLGIAAAAYIAEVALPTEREFLKPFVEILASIPSVVLGFFGLVVVAPAVKAMFGLDSGLTAMTGGLVLAFMAVPTIASVSEDAIRSVPDSYRQASFALGSSRQQTLWRVVIPAAIPGITAAVMLGFGRIVGETMAVLMVTGNAAKLTFSPFDSVRTMTATIAAEMGEVPFGSTHYHALFVVGAVLLVITFVLNLVAIRMFHKVGGR